MKASEGLFFFKEQAFQNVLFILLGVLGFLLLVGVGWELLYHRPKRRKKFGIFLISEIQFIGKIPSSRDYRHRHVIKLMFLLKGSN